MPTKNKIYLVLHAKPDSIKTYFRTSISECNQLAKELMGLTIKQRKYTEFYHKHNKGEEVLLIKQLEEELIDLTKLLNERKEN